MGDMRYVYVNTHYLGTQIKYVLKDLERGAYTREEAARRLRIFADKIEQMQPVYEQLTFDELQDKIQRHLGRRR